VLRSARCGLAKIFLQACAKSKIARDFKLRSRKTENMSESGTKKNAGFCLFVDVMTRVVMVVFLYATREMYCVCEG